MTIQMLRTWNGLEQHSVQAPGAVEEARLIAADLARDYTAGMDGKNIVFLEAEKAATQALVSGGGTYEIGPGNTIALIGDSRVVQGIFPTATEQNNYFFNLNALLYGRLRFVGLFGVGGKQLREVLAEQIPQVLAQSPRPTWVGMECGINDAANARTLDQMRADWLAIYTALSGAGIGLIQCTSLPIQIAVLPIAKQAILTEYNKFVLAQNGQRRGFIAFDGYAATVDTSDGKFLSALTYDSAHQNYEGAWQVAKLALPVVDPLIPKYVGFPFTQNNASQAIQNPMGNGTTGTVGAGITNTGGNSVPTGWDILRTGAATASITQVARSDNRRGNITRVTITAGDGTIADQVSVEPGRPWFKSWSSGQSLTAGDRVRPTVATGFQYLVRVAGSAAAGSDPTAGWSRVVGDSVVDGAVTLTVVPSIDVGDTVVCSVEIPAASFAAQAGAICIYINAYTAAFGLISVPGQGQYYSTHPIPTSAGGAQVVMTRPFVIPPTTGFLQCLVFIVGRNGAVVDIGAFNLDKATAY